MKTYALADAKTLHREVFDQALQAPVLLTRQSRPSHIILSAQSYQQLLDRLAELEDLAEANFQHSTRVNSDRFLAKLAQLANV
jgi:PHD/YefM family antitoxin component YafN of YafNO toxin-antitoxin module